MPTTSKPETLLAAAKKAVDDVVTDIVLDDDKKEEILEELQEHIEDNLRMLEGGHWTPERVVIIEFPNMASLNAWYTSAEYQPLIALRKSCTSDQDMTLAMEGL